MIVLAGLNVIVGSLNAAIGSYVLYKNPRSIIHRAFFIIAIGIAGWIFGMMSLVATSKFIFATISLLCGELAVLGFTVFARTFPNDDLRSRSLLFLLPWVGIVVLTPFHVFISSINFNNHGYIRPENGQWFPLFAMVMIGYVFTGFYYLGRTVARSQGIRRVQARYFLFGAVVFFCTALLCDVVFPAFKVFSFNTIGPLSSIAFVVCAAYAIVQHKFLDIEVIIKRSVVYFAIIVLAALFFFSFEFIIEKFYYNDEVVDIVAATIGFILFAWLKNVFTKVTDRIFFRADYDYAEAVRSLGPVLSSTIELNALVVAIDDFLIKTIKPAKVFFLINHADAPTFFIHQRDLRDDKPIIDFYAEIVDAGIPASKKIILAQAAETNASREDSRLSCALEKRDFSAAVPFLVKETIIGTLLLGKKLSGDILRPKDIALLSILSHQAGMAIDNARLYESIRKNNEELENIVASRTKEIREVYRTQEQFLVDISHELQTPIAILEGNLELAESSPAQHMGSSLRVMRDTLDGMSHLVSNFLETARLNFSKNKFQKERFDVGELVRDVYEDCFALTEAKRVRVSCSVNVAPIVGDKRKIKEVVLNLMSNALKHTKAGGEITLSAQRNGDFVEIIVRDTGAGISAENIPHLFERFYRIPGSGVRGNGLGLNICREIIELHGGTISVTSVIGEGSSFVIRLLPSIQPDVVASGIL